MFGPAGEPQKHILWRHESRNLMEQHTQQCVLFLLLAALACGLGAVCAKRASNAVSCSSVRLPGCTRAQGSLFQKKGRSFMLMALRGFAGMGICTREKILTVCQRVKEHGKSTGVQVRMPSNSLSIFKRTQTQNKLHAGDSTPPCDFQHMGPGIECHMKHRSST